LLSCFVVDLRERHLEYWTPNSDEHIQNITTQHTFHLSSKVCSSF
jgi:hypothetical protein